MASDGFNAAANPTTDPRVSHYTNDVYGTGNSLTSARLPNGENVQWGATIDSLLLQTSALTASYYDATDKTTRTLGMRLARDGTYEVSIDGVLPGGTSIVTGSNNSLMNSSADRARVFKQGLGVADKLLADGGPVDQEFKAMLSAGQDIRGEKIDQIANDIGSIDGPDLGNLRDSLNFARGIDTRPTTPAPALKGHAPAM
jgi:hypothetical protein